MVRLQPDRDLGMLVPTGAGLGLPGEQPGEEVGEGVLAQAAGGAGRLVTGAPAAGSRQ